MVEKKRSVCIVGGGAAGLATLKNLLVYGQQFGEIICYEQTKVVGGTWNYVPETGTDDNGLPIHSSMYQNLRTNLPKQIMEYPDFELTSDDCFMPHHEFLKYLNDYCSHFQLTEWIQFETVVRNISWNDVDSNWEVTVENFKDKSNKSVDERIITKEFDVVILCHGHYSSPLYCDCEGIDKFNGQIVHSHDYRTAEKYRDQKVLVIGAGISGTDVALELTKVTDQVYLLSRKVNRCYSELGDIKIVIGKLFEFGARSIQIKLNNSKQDDQNESEILTLENFDTIFVCTGYRMDFDLLDPNCGISVNSDNTVNGFYKHIVNIAHPSMAAIGINSSIPPCKLFHLQSLYYIQYLLGAFQLPKLDEINRLEDEEMKLKLSLGQRPKDKHKFHISMVEPYFRGLESEAGLGMIFKPVIVAIYNDIKRNMCEMPLTFKKVVYKIINDYEFIKE